MKITQKSNAISSVPLIGVALEKGLHQPVKPEPGERQGQGGTERAGSFSANYGLGQGIGGTIPPLLFLFSKIWAGIVDSPCPSSRHVQRPALACKPRSSPKLAPLGLAKCTWSGWGSDWQVWIRPILRRRGLDVWHSTNWGRGWERGTGIGWILLPRYPLRGLGLENSTDSDAHCCGNKTCCQLQMALSCQDGWMESAGNRNYPCYADLSEGFGTTSPQDSNRAWGCPARRPAAVTRHRPGLRPWGGGGGAGWLCVYVCDERGWGCMHLYLCLRECACLWAGSGVPVRVGVCMGFWGGWAGSFHLSGLSGIWALEDDRQALGHRRWLWKGLVEDCRRGRTPWLPTRTQKAARNWKALRIWTMTRTLWAGRTQTAGWISRAGPRLAGRTQLSQWVRMAGLTRRAERARRTGRTRNGLRG